MPDMEKMKRYVMMDAGKCKAYVYIPENVTPTKDELAVIRRFVLALHHHRKENDDNGTTVSTVKKRAPNGR